MIIRFCILNFQKQFRNSVILYGVTFLAGIITKCTDKTSFPLLVFPVVIIFSDFSMKSQLASSRLIAYLLLYESIHCLQYKHFCFCIVGYFLFCRYNLYMGRGNTPNGVITDLIALVPGVD